MQRVAVVVIAFLLPLASCEHGSLMEAGTSEKCNKLQSDYACRDSDYSKSVGEIYLSCGPGYEESAELFNVICAIREDGEYCIQIFAVIDADDSILESGKACVNSTDCSDECKTFLQGVVDDAGCCIGVINEDYEQRLLGFDIDAALEKCSIDPVPSCEGTFDTTPLDDPDSCTTQEFYARHAAYICMNDVAEPFIKAMREESECAPLARDYEMVCGRGPGNVYCQDLLASFIIPSSPIDTANTHPELSGVLAACETASLDSCPGPCKTALESALAKFGCCLNTFNDTINDILTPQFGADVMHR